MKPKQFNFLKEWKNIKELSNEPGIKYGIERMWQHWMELASWKKEEFTTEDRDQVEAQYYLDLVTLKVKKWDFHWLSEVFGECYDIPIDLSLGIAETYFPDKEWEIIEQSDFMVVADAARTIVFDFLSFKELPAGASLHLAGDKKYQADDLDLRAALNFKQRNIKRMEDTISKMRSDIDYFDSQAKENVLHFKPPSVH